MATRFARSLRSLEGDRHRSSLVALAFVALVLAGWGVWLFCAELDVLETSADARLETEAPRLRVEAPIDGRVTEVLVELGQSVRAGDPLVRLESVSARLELEEAESRLRAIAAQIDPLDAEIAAALDARASDDQTTRGTLAEARARQRAAAAEARIAEETAERLSRLPDGSIAELRRSELAAERASRASTADAAAFAIERLRWERALGATDRAGKLEALRRELARVHGERDTAQAAVDLLRHRLEERVIAAPHEGTVAELAEGLSPGSYARAGEPLLSLLPRGDLHAVAYFAPAEVFGRVEPGQPAKIRLDGFPWTRFGMLDARVTRVADETSERGVRVELALESPERFEAPLEHGLPGSVEVEIDRVSPFDLLLRAAGRKTPAAVASGGPR